MFLPRKIEKIHAGIEFTSQRLAPLHRFLVFPPQLGLPILIDESGAVERVRLRAKTPAPGQTLYRHRMLIAAAKAWQFEPAQLNGQPVRYVMRVPLEP